MAPPPRNLAPSDDWSPFPDKDTFQIVDFVFREDQMSNAKIDRLADLWGQRHHDDRGSPFASHREVHAYIDSIQQGEAPWHRLETTPAVNHTPDTPLWQTRQYDVWYRDPKKVIANMLDSAEFKDVIDYAPYQLHRRNGKRCWTNFLSGNFSWRQSVSSVKTPICLH